MGIRKLIVTFICAAALSFSGCSRLHFAYHHLGWFILPKIKSFTNFDAAQRRQIDMEFASYMAWHRYVMLPEYAKLLNRLAAELVPGKAADLKTMHELRLEVQLTYEKTIMPILAPSARVMVTLTEAQLQALEKNFVEMDIANRKRFEDKPLVAKIAERDTRILDGIQDWSGPLSQGQSEVLHESMHRLPFTSEDWAENWKKNRAELLSRLRAKQGVGEIEKILKSWMIDGRKRYTKLEGPIEQLMFDVVSTLNDRQRKRFHDRLAGYARDCEELAHEKL